MARTNTAHVWPVLDAAFREFGLPHYMRSDNGSPFASRGAGGLSRLSVKLIKAGVTPERIVPGKPQQNGRHERMHLTLLQEVANPPAPTMREQLKRWIVTLITHIRAGTFQLKPRSDQCTVTCDYGHVCRIGQSRPAVEGKTWSLPLPTIP